MAKIHDRTLPQAGEGSVESVLILQGWSLCGLDARDYRYELIRAQKEKHISQP